LNVELVAPERPAAEAVSEHPVHTPVTRRSLNVAIPLIAFTVVVPLSPPTTMDPSSLSDTAPEKAGAVLPWASRAVTSTENVPFRRSELGGCFVNWRLVAGGGGVTLTVCDCGALLAPRLSVTVNVTL
jgi:hypothetical protein